MATESDTYLEITRLVRQLTELLQRTEPRNIDAQTREQFQTLQNQARRHCLGGSENRNSEVPKPPKSTRQPTIQRQEELSKLVTNFVTNDREGLSSILPEVPSSRLDTMRRYVSYALGELTSESEIEKSQRVNNAVIALGMLSVCRQEVFDVFVTSQNSLTKELLKKYNDNDPTLSQTPRRLMTAMNRSEVTNRAQTIAFHKSGIDFHKIGFGVFQSNSIGTTQNNQVPDSTLAAILIDPFEYGNHKRAKITTREPLLTRLERAKSQDFNNDFKRHNAILSQYHDWLLEKSNYFDSARPFTHLDT
jgi:hypothetical protein